ncbi:hypothetical protein QLQ15_09545 [Lysobacter sp. LF1]|uniref:Secreted protein n=1 Tax=Lysobacter stagni TaxID=3045172 RepID=A0ABT6XGH6_9GAMM|nr:hypothetical protein [Lysobacter sp. LF1]MDI9239153.1 hypothetical protein [Lysobacter sp. LF1]
MDGRRATCAFVLVVAVAAATLTCPSVRAGSESGRKLDDVQALVEARQQAVDAELKQLGPHAWAGEYYEGDGLGSNTTLSLAPRSGVAATLRGCLGLYRANLGSIESASQGLLRFRFDVPRDAGTLGFPEELQLVRWGARRYLIAPSSMQDFVNAMHGGSEPRITAYGRFLLAKGDEGKPVQGLPGLPERYLAAIRSEPLEAGVLRVERVSAARHGEFCEKRYRITLNRGALDGLAAGVELTTRSPDDVYERLRVDVADDVTASGELTIHEDECDAPAEVPDRRWVFTTGHYTPIADTP